MYNDYIKEKISEKLDYDIHFLKEYLIIYFHFLIFFFSKTECRKKLTTFIKQYFQYTKEEYKLLSIIKKLEEDDELEEICIPILEQLEEVFLKHHELIDLVMNGYEEAIFYKDITSCYFQPRKFETEILEEQIKLLKRYRDLGNFR